MTTNSSTHDDDVGYECAWWGRRLWMFTGRTMWDYWEYRSLRGEIALVDPCSAPEGWTWLL